MPHIQQIKWAAGVASQSCIRNRHCAGRLPSCDRLWHLLWIVLLSGRMTRQCDVKGRLKVMGNQRGAGRPERGLASKGAALEYKGREETRNQISVKIYRGKDAFWKIRSWGTHNTRTGVWTYRSLDLNVLRDQEKRKAFGV